MTESHTSTVRGTPSVSVVAMGASAGGLHALTAVLGVLPATFPAPIALVQHLKRDHPSRLCRILGRKLALEVVSASDGADLRPGTVHVAPPDHDLSLASDGAVTLTPCPDVPFSCPSVDRLLTSASVVHATRAVAVVLTGAGQDGAMGVVAVRAAGGRVVVEDPRTAAFDGMPRAAIATGAVDVVLPAPDIGSILLDLAGGKAA